MNKGWRAARVSVLVALALACGACGRAAQQPARGDGMSTGVGQGSKSTNEQGGGVRVIGPVVYVALGDSTGVGVGARRGGGYVARLFERIERVRPGSRVVNLCASGARTADVLRGQAPRVAAARPTLVTVGVGINDVTNNVPVEEFARNFDALLARLRETTDAPVVVTNIPDISPAPAVPAFARAEAARRIALFNQRLAEIAARYNVTVVDAYTMSRDIIPAHPEFFSADGFHPSDEGYEYWAKMLWPAVKPAIGAE
ncbi:MAG TPA: SGNH/GDSL hydrolase family protein [Pyrinomonadaceae bacterium]|jgi:lysophospholipase L1-like esterase